MVFSSMIFLWLFLPVVVVLYYISAPKLKNIILLLASLVFYAWGEPVYVFLMIGSIICNWVIGLLMDRSNDYKKFWLAVAIILNVGVLGVFKYLDFFLEIIGSVLGKTFPAVGLSLPIGISFFTFQILSYEIDLYRGQYAVQKNIVKLAVYISFFPQLIAGPIVRYKDINEQLEHREITLEKTAEGIRRFAYGLGKKVLIANTLAELVDTVYGLGYSGLTGLLAWIAAVFYMLQIYYDFSGYSDMAIGLGKIFGFEFLENFNYPYLSKSIHEFWQRWHISLGTWFREYVYIPLGGNRLGTRITYENLIIVFLLTGLWHGAAATFICWGLYHGFFQIVERLGFSKFLERHKVAAHGYTFLVVLFGWVLFRSDSILQAGWMIKRMIMPWRYTQTTIILFEEIGAREITVALLGIIGCGIIQAVGGRKDRLAKFKHSYIEVGVCAALILISISSLAAGTYNPFIYFRF